MGHTPYGYRIEDGKAVVDEKLSEQVKELYSGYHGLFYALVNTYNNGINLLDSSYIKNISMKDFDAILYGNTSIPMLEERYRILKEYGNELDKFGNLYNLFIKAKSDN